MPKKLLKKYVVIYRSQEHYEVLGYVRASDIKEAIIRAQKELKNEAKFYEVVEAEIGELEDQKKITFDIDKK